MAQKEIVLSYEEANKINDAKGDSLELDGFNQQYCKGGFTLDKVVNGKTYRLFYDHETWFTEIAYELVD